MADIKSIFGKNLRKYRKIKGFSQEELADLLELGSKSISPIECGHRFISVDKIERICDVLEIPPYLLFVSDDSKAGVSDEYRQNEIMNILQSSNREKLDFLYNVLKKCLDK